jgi:para-aminobenzoate synthetase
VCTEHGDRLVANFLRLTGGRRSPRRSRPVTVPEKTLPEKVPAPTSDFELRTRRFRLDVDPERAFLDLFAREERSFWLDSSAAEPSERARFSFMGGAGGPHGLAVRYDVGSGVLTVEREGATEERREGIFDFLDRELARRRCDAPDLPFDFHGGFVGYLGYELKAECGARRAHRSELPDAAFLLADRVVVFDRLEGEVHLLALDRAGAVTAEARRWLDRTARRLRRLAGEPPSVAAPPAGRRRRVDFRLDRSRATYLRDVETCLEEIRQGESYEVCLTNQLRARVAAPPLEIYRLLRRENPAPYAAYLGFGDCSVLSSSPELFLKVDRERRITSKPIKGTAPRHDDPAADRRSRRRLAANVKDRAENLMIVDLLRNDLGRVCEVGSVHVPGLMEVESYATVHQLVSTVRGRLRPGKTAVDGVRAAFPGGSMTGAPKLRTMEIIDRLEGRARGVYSGAIGFLGWNGTAELNVVIRTAVVRGDELSIGVGGAVVALSDPEAEVAETLLKAKALVRAVVRAETGAFTEEGCRIAGLEVESPAPLELAS